MHHVNRLLMILFALGASAGAFAVTAANTEGERRQYTYAWQFAADGEMKPRGGTTRGTDVSLANQPSKAWVRLQESGLSSQERDRRAILAMAGPYRTSFDFIETVGFAVGYEPRRPYQSWGTEYVYVVADQPDMVSLQHILVMHFVPKNPSGEKTTTPAKPQTVVVKHWRQDWHYQKRELFVYAGHSRWRAEKQHRRDVKGRWTQSVYQVDDSPRYQAAGQWLHYASYSSWQSDETWRPLPRREFSVRDDYHVLIGTNRHTIYPTGWVQEEDNLKVVLAADGKIAAQAPILARETGLARYERIDNHDWSAGDEYWRRTSEFWASVRAVWTKISLSETSVLLAPKNAEGKSLFGVMFKLAEKLSAPNEGRVPQLDEADRQRRIRQVLDDFVR